MIPAGSTPLGAFAESPSPPGLTARPILADWIDPLTGDIPLAYLLKSRTPVDGAIIEALRVERGSGPAVEFVGNTLREIRHTDDTSLSEAPGRLRVGLKTMEDAGLVRMLRVTRLELTARGDGMDLEVQISDLTLPSGKQDATTYAVSRGMP
jgi:hypothetical protein